MEDILWDSLTDSYTGFPMAITAENLAEQYKISKEDCDKYALQTQQRWKAGEFKRAYAINTRLNLCKLINFKKSISILYYVIVS